MTRSRLALLSILYSIVVSSFCLYKKGNRCLQSCLVEVGEDVDAVVVDVDDDDVVVVVDDDDVVAFL